MSAGRSLFRGLHKWSASPAARGMPMAPFQQPQGCASLKDLCRPFSSHPLSQPMLSTEQVASFRRNGFVVMKDLFTATEKTEIFKAVCDDIQQWPLKRGEHMQYFEKVNGSFQLCRTENYLDYHPALAELVGNGSKPSLAAGQLLGDPSGQTLVFKERINYKLPGGGGFAAHQDAPAWSGDDPTADDAELPFMRHTLNMNIAIDRMYKENGGLEVVKLDKFDGKMVRCPQNPDGTITEEFCAQQVWSEVVLEPGDVLFFNLHIPHRSGRNETPSPRRAVYITYAGASYMAPEERIKYYETYRKQFPPAGEHESDAEMYEKGNAVYNWATPIAAEQPRVMV